MNKSHIIPLSLTASVLYYCSLFCVIFLFEDIAQLALFTTISASNSHKFYTIFYWIFVPFFSSSPIPTPNVSDESTLMTVTPLTLIFSLLASWHPPLPTHISPLYLASVWPFLFCKCYLKRNLIDCKQNWIFIFKTKITFWHFCQYWKKSQILTKTK